MDILKNPPHNKGDYRRVKEQHCTSWTWNAGEGCLI